MTRKDMVAMRTYCSIIQGSLKVNDVSGALRLFEEMKDYGLVPDVSTYTALIQNLFNLNEYGKAKGLYNEMLESGQEPDDVVIMAIVAGLVSHNKSEALEFLRSMEEKRSNRNRRRTYLLFIKELCKVASGNEILDVMQEMQDSKIAIPDELFCRILFHFERNGCAEQFEKLKQIRSKARLGVDDMEPLVISTGSSSNPETRNDPVHRSPETIDCQIPGSPSSAKILENVEEICRILLSSKD